MLVLFVDRISESPRWLTDRRTLLTLNTTNAREQMVTKSWTPAAHKCFPSGGCRSRQKKSYFMRGTQRIVTKSTARSQSSRRFGHLSKITFFCDWNAVLPCARFRGFRRTFASFRDSGNSPNRISRRSLYRSLFGVSGVQKGARLGPAGATPLGRAGGREHDILGRQNVSEAAGAAAEHEGRPVESERGRVVARMVRLTDSEKNTRCARGRNAPATGSATRRRRPCASNPPRRPPRRELSSFPRDRADEIAARPRAAPRGRPVFAPPVPLFPRASLAASDWPDRVRLTAPAPPLPRESAGICTTA